MIPHGAGQATLKVTAGVRLAVRTEGPEVKFYMAERGTMDRAELLITVRRQALEIADDENRLFNDLVKAASEWLSRQIEAVTGQKPEMIRQQPLEPPEGNA